MLRFVIGLALVAFASAAAPGDGAPPMPVVDAGHVTTPATPLDGPCEDDSDTFESPTGEEMTCTDMAAMHACKHPEDGYLISASCKKSCNQCSTGCAAAATTAADQVATGAADDDDDDDGDDDGSAGSRRLTLNDEDRDVERAIWCSDKSLHCETWKKKGKCDDDNSRQKNVMPKCRTTCEFKGHLNYENWKHENLTEGHGMWGLTCEKITWALPNATAFAESADDMKYTWKPHDEMTITECMADVHGGCKGSADINPSGGWLTLEEAKAACQKVNFNVRTTNKDGPNGDVDILVANACTGVVCRDVGTQFQSGIDCDLAGGYDPRYNVNTADANNPDITFRQSKEVDVPQRFQISNKDASSARYSPYDAHNNFRYPKLDWSTSRMHAYTFDEEKITITTAPTATTTATITAVDDRRG